jgi:hypothetical protein
MFKITYVQNFVVPESKIMRAFMNGQRKGMGNGTANNIGLKTNEKPARIWWDEGIDGNNWQLFTKNPEADRP